MTGANIVRNFQIGNTQIKIADNYCKKTTHEVEQILQRIAKQAQREFIAAATVKNYEKKESEKLSADYR